MSEKNMIANRYMVVTSLGSGGMADVYLAIDTILNREVAVKVLRGDAGSDPVSLLRFQREASAISKLHHPNVVEVYDIGEYDGKNYIVMEYIRGKTLKQLIRQRGALPVDEAVAIMKQLVEAVNHAHENNIIHRDIKPQNVLIKDDGTVKITDFGIALAHDAVQLTQSDSVLGSAHYIAPETTRGETSTVQIDIYALGIVFYELLTGSVPFTGENPVQVAMKHMREDIPSVREFNQTIPQSVENIIIRATAKNRVYRYASTKDMTFDLNMCLMKEFANVDKVVFDEAEEPSSGTMVFDGTAKTKIPKEDTDKKDDKDKQDNSKKKRRNKIILAVVAALALLGAGGTLAVYYMGIVDGFSPVEYVNVPNLDGLTKEGAEEMLAQYGLELSDDITYDRTDTTSENLIYEQSPKSGERVTEGSKVKVSISTGTYFVVGNYVNMSLEDAKAAFAGTKIEVLTEYEERTDIAAGIILEQSLLPAGEKVNPTVSTQIRFKVSKSISIQLVNYSGMSISAAKELLENQGIKVELIVQDVPEGLEEYKLNVVINQSPKSGEQYTQTTDSTVKLYYYEKNNEEQNQEQEKEE